MNIFIDKVLNKIIYFSSDYGNAKGIWRGENRPIEKGYCVELDIETLYDYDDFSVSIINEYQMKIVDERIKITLLLLEYDEDGCATFRLGDSIVEIETHYDERFVALKNSYLTVFVEKLNIYDENL